MKHLLSVLVLLVGIHLITIKIIVRTPPRSPPPSPTGPTPTSLLSAPSDLPKPGFDYFVLSLTWPNAFCKSKNVTCTPFVPKQYFTIHGLWPEKNRQPDGPHPIYCEANPLQDKILVKNKKKLLQFWPSLKSADNFSMSMWFWRHEWKKHGSCSSNKFSQEDYINKTIELGSKYGGLKNGSLIKKLEDAGIKPDGSTPYSSKYILKAIKNATGFKAYINCKNDTLNTLQLYEIRLCVKADAKNLQNCPGNRSCESNFIFASPPSRRFPTFELSIIKDEEAAEL